MRHDHVDAAAVRKTGVGKRRGLVDAAADLVHDALGDLEQMLFVTELDLRELQLSLLFDEGLLRAVHHDVADVGIVQQLFQGPEAEQFVDQHLFQRELFAAVEVDLQFGEHLADDRPEFLGQFVLRQHRGRFGVDAFEEAREHLLLDLVNGGLETLDLRRSLLAGSCNAVLKARHGVGLLRGGIGRVGERGAFNRRELLAGGFGRADGRTAALHRASNTEGGALCARSAYSAPPSESIHLKSAHIRFGAFMDGNGKQAVKGRLRASAKAGTRSFH